MFVPAQGSVRSIKSVPGTNDLPLGGQGEERICSVDNIGLSDDLTPEAASQGCLTQTQRLFSSLRLSGIASRSGDLPCMRKGLSRSLHARRQIQAQMSDLLHGIK